MKVSIIIPTLNEQKIIAECLLALQPLRSQCELIVVDGGSTDNTPRLAAPLADRVITSAKGRAKQMNRGVTQATGEVLLFLHADTFLPDNALQLIQQAISKQRQWGRFDIQLSGQSFILKIIAKLMGWRSRLTGVATGDQAIFVTRSVFDKVGYYPDIPLMEDIALCQALKKISPPICLTAKVISSGRRWERQGIARTILLMWHLRWRYFLGADPQTLAALYAHGFIKNKPSTKRTK